jgi:hypothetical protein
LSVEVSVFYDSNSVLEMKNKKTTEHYKYKKILQAQFKSASISVSMFFLIVLPLTIPRR